MSEIRMLLDEIRDLKRRLQALETRQEHPGFAASDVARLSVDNAFAGVQTISNTGLHLLDTNASHDLIIAPGSNLTADRTLTLTTGDANRTLTMTGNAVLNQDVSTAGSPSFLNNVAINGSGTEVYLEATASNTAGRATLVATASTGGASLSVKSHGATWSETLFSNSMADANLIISNTAALLAIGTYDATPVIFGTSNTERMRILSGGNVLIGTTADSGTKLAVYKSLTGYSATAYNPSTISLLTDDSTGYYSGIRFSGSGGSREAMFGVVATAGTTGDFVFQGYSGSAYLEYMRVKSNGNVLIGTTTDNGGKLQVDQSSTTAAIPALRLNQADISEGFVDFIGTSAASAAGPISSWTVATIAGYVRCEINGADYWMAYYNAPTA